MTDAVNTVRRKKARLHEGNRFFTVIMYIVIALLTFIAIYPVYYVLIMSISEPKETAAMTVYWYPKGFYIDAYKIILRDSDLWMAYGNSIIYVISTTVLTLITCVIGAYPLTSPKLKGRKLVTFFLLIPMYFGGGLIPNYLLMSKLGLYDNMWALIIPGSFSIWYIILTKTYFQSLPETMREAARIDGANNFQIMLRLYLPLAKPILAVIAVYTIVGVWNSWFSAMIYLPNPKIQPLQLYLRRILIEQNIAITKELMSVEEAAAAAAQKLTNNQLKYAMIVFTTLPVLFVYPFFQKHFVKGVMLGSLKG